MVNQTFSRIVAFMTLAACAVTSQAAPSKQLPIVPPMFQGVHRVVCLGDSITEQGEQPGGYVWLIRHYLAHLYPDQHIETLNAGISGHKSNDMLGRFQRDVLDKKPDLITISVGVNDVWHGFFNHPNGDGPNGIPLKDYVANVEAMVTQAQAQKIKVVILSATVIEENLEDIKNTKAIRYNEALFKVARAHMCPYVDLQKSFRALIQTYRTVTGGHDNLLTVDGVHMNSSGNKVMAHTILSTLGVPAEAQARVQDQVAREMSGS